MPEGSVPAETYKPPISKYRYDSSGDFSLEKINDFGILIRCENMESKRYQNDN